MAVNGTACDPHEHEGDVRALMYAHLILPTVVLGIAACKLCFHTWCVKLYVSRASIQFVGSLRRTIIYGFVILIADTLALCMRVGCGTLFFSSNEALFFHYYGPFSCGFTSVTLCTRIPQVLFCVCALLLVLVWRNYLAETKLPITLIVFILSGVLCASQVVLIVLGGFEQRNLEGDLLYWNISNAIMGVYLICIGLGGFIFARRLESRLQQHSSISTKLVRTRRRVGRIAFAYAGFSLILIAAIIFNVFCNETIGLQTGFWWCVLINEMGIAMVFIVAIRSPSREVTNRAIQTSESDSLLRDHNIDGGDLISNIAEGHRRNSERANRRRNSA